jgi:hypothetical protein
MRCSLLMRKKKEFIFSHHNDSRTLFQICAVSLKESHESLGENIFGKSPAH